MKMAYFILPDKKDKNGYIPCLVKEEEIGFFETDFRWNCTLEKAENMAEKMNEKMGVSRDFANRLILRSMRS